MEKTTLYIGGNDQHTKTQLVDMETQRNTIANICFDYVDGATIYTGNGLYKHNDGQKINEQCTIVVLYNVEIATVKQIVETAKSILNQESIAVEFAQCNFNFM